MYHFFNYSFLVTILVIINVIVIIIYNYSTHYLDYTDTYHPFNFCYVVFIVVKTIFNQPLVSKLIIIPDILAVFKGCPSQQKRKGFDSKIVHWL